jgi:hypothetical protein
VAVPGVTDTVTAAGGEAGAVTVRLNGSLTVEPGSGFKTVRAYVPAAEKVPFAFRVPADGDAVVGQAIPLIWIFAVARNPAAVTVSSTSLPAAGRLGETDRITAGG